MINLIPPEGHKVMKREYIFRVVGTLSFLLGSIFLILTIAFVPTFVLIGAQIQASLNEVKENKDDRESLEKIDAEMRVVNGLTQQFKKTKTTVSASTAIEEIRKLAPSNIVFNTILVEDSSGQIKKIQVQGKAPTREALARLKSSLESSELFMKAEVPISDLARDVDLPFTVTITLTEGL